MLPVTVKREPVAVDANAFMVVLHTPKRVPCNSTTHGGPPALLVDPLPLLANPDDASDDADDAEDVPLPALDGPLKPDDAPLRADDPWPLIPLVPLRLDVVPPLEELPPEDDDEEDDEELLLPSSGAVPGRGQPHNTVPNNTHAAGATLSLMVSPCGRCRRGPIRAVEPATKTGG